MTLRNWAIGYYIVEYKQGRSDRVEYGAHLLKNLENQISEKGLNTTLFKACRQFYLVYPQMLYEPDVIITEDSNSGYEFFSNVSEEQLMLDSLQKFRYSYIVKFEWTFPDSIIFLPHSYLVIVVWLFWLFVFRICL